MGNLAERLLLRWGEAWFDYTASMLWQSALVIGIVWVVARLARNRSASFRYALWMLVIVRLLLPPTFASPIGVGRLGQPLLNRIPHNLAPVFDTEQSVSATLSRREFMGPFVGGTPPATVDQNPYWFKQNPFQRSSRVVLGLFLLWAAGALSLASLVLTRHRRFRAVEKASQPVPLGPLYALFKICCEQIPPPSLLRVRFHTSSGLPGPFLAGVWRPRIILPERLVTRCSKEELRTLILHELAHIRRWDILVKWAETVLLVVNWYNPVVWLTVRALRIERERCCDDRVLAATQFGRKAYGGGLVKVLEVAARRAPVTLGVLGLIESRPDVYHRLKRVMDRTRRITPNLSLASLVGVILLGSVILATAPWETAGQASVEPPRPSSSASSEETDSPNVMSTSAAQGSLADSPPPLGQRVIHFPEDRSLGRLSIQTGPGERYPTHVAFSQFGEWEYIGQAVGDVPVPRDGRIMLQTNKSALKDLSPLSSLGPNDLYQLEIWGYMTEISNPDETIMPHLQRLTGLRRLALSYVDVSARGLRFLEPLTSLTHLWIRPTSSLLPVDALTLSPELQDAGVAELAKLKSLEVLNLASREVTDEGIAHLAELQSLRQLRLWCPKVQGPGLAHLAKLPLLERFATNTVKLGDRGVAYLKDCTFLRRLELSYLGLTDAGMAHFSGMTRLEELWLVGNNITDRGLVRVKPLRQLRLLELGRTRITPNAVFYLKELKSLEDLGLGVTDITDMHLAELSELTNLRRLFAGGTSNGPISDEGLRHLSRLKRLEELSVCGNRITAEGVAYLAGIPNLHRLGLLSETLDDDVFTALATIKPLTWLDLSGQGLTLTGLTQLNRLSGLKRLKVWVAQDNSGLDLSGLTGLESLNLFVGEPSHPDPRHHALRDEDMACLANFKRLKQLIVTEYNAYLTDAGMSHLAGLTEMDYLSIGGPQLTDDALSYMSNMKKLRRLYIRGVFTDDALRHLEGLENLEYVQMSTTGYISSGAVARLKRNLPSLQTFDVR